MDRPVQIVEFFPHAFACECGSPRLVQRHERGKTVKCLACGKLHGPFDYSPKPETVAGPIGRDVQPEMERATLVGDPKPAQEKVAAPEKSPPVLLQLLFPFTYLAAGFLFPIPYALPALIWGYGGGALCGQFLLGHAVMGFFVVKGHKHFESVSRFVAMILVLYAGLWVVLGLLGLLLIAIDAMLPRPVVSKDSLGDALTLVVVSGVLVGAGTLQYYLTPGDPWSDPKF